MKFVFLSHPATTHTKDVIMLLFVGRNSLTKLTSTRLIVGY